MLRADAVTGQSGHWATPAVVGSLRRWVPALAVGIVLVVVWVINSTPVPSLLRYALCCAWLVVLPGVVVRRLALGRAKDWVEEIAVGAAVGLVLLIPVWAVLTRLGAFSLILAWPIAIVAPFVWRPRPRESLRAASPQDHVPEVAGWLLALAVTAALLVWSVGFAATTQLPPGPFKWYQDDYWQLSLAAELGRRVPPDIPQVAGHPFMYHWFANANISTMSKASGLDLVLVYARLWEPPLRILVVALAFVLGRRLSGSAVAGALLGVMVAAGTELRASWFSLPGHAVLNLHSPSQLFGVIVLLLVLLLLIDLLQGRRGRGRAALLVGSSLSAVGAKASIPPVILTGTGLVWLRAITQRWIGATDTTVRRATLALALGLGTVVAGLLFAAGGSAGVSVQLFAGARLSSPWVLFTGRSEDLTGSFLMPGLGRSGGPVLLLLVLLQFVVSFAWLAPAWPLLRRGTAAAWLLLGVGIGGLLAMLVLDQDGASQVYFMMGALVAWQALAVWGLSDCLARARAQMAPDRVLRAALLGAAVGVLLSSFLQHVSGERPAADAVIGSVAQSLAIVAVVGVVAAALLMRLRGAVGVAAATALIAASSWFQVLWALQLQPSRRILLLAIAGLVLALLLPAPAVRPLLAACLALTVAHTVWTVGRADRPKPLSPNASGIVTQQEYAAARWLADNTPVDDIIATNVHCTGTRTVPKCDVRAFWVTAFGERRALLESWAYTTEAHERQGLDGLRSTRQPFHDPAFYAANERAFTAPTVDNLAHLRSLGVRWLFADTNAGPVAPQLATLAQPVHTSGPVTIYRLR
ncbi:hypothetical protein [Calidifontibacter indicus]|uniref:hypothetical protein n=1 Tax=Calidifontibacter indicus TaxID=419650 RepID=UPI003D756DA1